MRTRWNLTKSEQKAHSANSERLKSAGVAIAIERPAFSESPLLRIDQSESSFIYAGARTGIALALCVRLMALKSGITLLDECKIIIPGCDDLNIFWVPLPERALSYKVFGWLDPEKGAVLNHLILNGHPLPYGRIFDGILLAQSFGQLPTYFATGMRINAEICLVDQFDNPYTSEVELIVERYEQGGEHARKGDGLLAPRQVGWHSSLAPSPRTSPSVLGKTVSAVKEDTDDGV
jgi:hypothetical protein